MTEKDEIAPRGTTKNSRLFTYNILDIKDELDEKLERCYRELTQATSSLRENEVFEQLNIKVSRSPQDHEETTLALLFSILTNPSIAHKSYSTLTLVSRDSMSMVIHFTELLILEKLPKLLETTKIQLMWLTKELTGMGVAGADRLCFAFLKQMPAGSTAPPDIWLAENLLHLFLDNRAWLEKQPPLIMSVVFTYLSILPTHLYQPSLTQLKEQEIEFMISLLRTKFVECSQIGRDLIRLLQNVSRVPEFTKLWYDLLNQPEKLDPSFTGVSQILSRRTSRRFVAGRIVTDSEIKMNFLLSKVKFGEHKRYQDWFSRKYLSTTESLSVVPELIRFVCCVIHPPNEVLGSDILPRWAFIGWLLSLVQPHPVVLANAKLALFYDWLNYSPTSDNIMNIEPAALLMYHSLRSHPQITQSLLDFLCRLAAQFSTQYNVATGIQSAFQDIVKKGVLPSLDSFLNNVKIDQDLRELIKSTFPDLFPSQNNQIDDISNVAPSQNDEDDDKCLVIATDEELTAEDDEIKSVLSNDEPTSDDIWSPVKTLPVPLPDKMEQFRANSDSVELLKEILKLLEAKPDNVIDKICGPLTHCLVEDFEQPRTDIIPLHILLQSNLIELVSQVRECQNKLGYYLIHYLHQSNNLERHIYSKYLPTNVTVQTMLIRDLRICADEDHEYFFQLLPQLYSEFSDDLIGCTDIINIIVSHVDPQQLNSLIIQLSLKKLTLFGKTQLQDIVLTSVQWDSFEQFSLWQLLNAESPESHHIVNTLRQLSSPTETPEAIAGIIQLLKQEPSIPGAVGNLLSLPMATHSEVVLVVASRWISSKPNKLAKFIDYCINKVLKVNEPLPTLMTMLDHLENIIKHLANCELFKSFDYNLSQTLDKLFNKYNSLSVKHPEVTRSVKESLSSQVQNEKRRVSSSDNEEIVRTKKRRVMTLEDLSD